MSEGFPSLETDVTAATALQSAAAISAATQSTAPASVEWDHKGRVVRTRLTGGHSCQFRYDEQGSLYGFTYARLAWSTTDGIRWTACDHANTYTIDAMINVAVDGTIRVERRDLRRYLKLNGRLIDEFTNGSILESERALAEPTPADLLATASPRPVEMQDLPRITPVLPMPAVDAPARAPETPEPPALAERKVIGGGVRINRMRQLEKAIAEAPPAQPDFGRTMRTFVETSKMRILETLKGPQSVAIANSLDVLAEAAHEEGRTQDAKELHERALEIRKKTLGAKHADVGVNLYGIGRIHQDYRQYTEAEQCYTEAIRLFEDGVRKIRFMAEIGVERIERADVYLTRLITAMHSLATVYHENKKRPHCQRLYKSALEACQLVQHNSDQVLQPLLQSMGAMAAPPEVEKQPPEYFHRTPRLDRVAF